MGLTHMKMNSENALAWNKVKQSKGQEESFKNQCKQEFSLLKRKQLEQQKRKETFIRMNKWADFKLRREKFIQTYLLFAKKRQFLIKLVKWVFFRRIMRTIHYKFIQKQKYHCQIMRQCWIMFQAYLNFRKTLVRRYGRRDLVSRDQKRIIHQVNMCTTVIHQSMHSRASMIVYKWLEERAWRFNTG